MRIVRQAQRGLDCGGPPQTRRSRWREQHQNARAGGRSPELLFERGLIEIRERRLSRGRLARSVPVVRGRAK